MDSNEIAAYYDENCRNSQYGWQASCLFSEEDQYVRFSAVNNIIAPNSSVLDVGCGQGDFCPLTVSKNLLYTGVDVSGLMIEKAQQKFPKANFVQWDFLENKIDEKFDYVLALGTFSLKVSDDQYEYIKSALKKCFENANKAVITTILTTTSDVKFEGEESKLFYYDPEKLFSIAQEITPYLVFNTATLPCEVILTMFRF